MEVKEKPTLSIMDLRNILLCAHLGAAACIPIQLAAQKVFDLGIKAGVSSDDLALGGASTEQVLGYHGGLFARVKPPLFPGIQGEALFTTVGTSAASGDLADDVRFRFNYVQFPVFLVFAFGPAELHAGGYYGHPLSSDVEGLSDVVAPPDAQEDYGLLGGVGLHLGRFYAGARYNLGLNDLGSDTPISDEARNRQAQLYVGFGLFK
jgi:hypothetical protein